MAGTRDGDQLERSFVTEAVEQLNQRFEWRDLIRFPVEKQSRFAAFIKNIHRPKADGRADGDYAIDP